MKALFHKLRTRLVAKVAALASVATVVAGCEQDSSSGDVVSVSDSAGVVIVQNQVAPEALVRPLELERSPSLSIGEADGSPAYEFYEVVGATVLSDGRLAVANRGTSEVKIYWPDGTHDQTIGREGEGPGEFRFLSTIQRLPGDTIMAFDGVLDRATFFTASGELLEVLTFERVLSGVPSQITRLRDGSFVSGRSWGSGQVTAEQRSRQQVFRSQTPISRFRADGSFLDTLGVFPDRDVLVFEERGGIVVTTARFSHRLQYAVHGSRVYIGTQDDFSINVFDLSGALKRSIRVSTPDLSMSAEHVAEMRERLVRALGRTAEQVDHTLVDRGLKRPKPDRVPAFERLLADEMGNLWVSEYVGVYGEEPESWTVLDGAGRLKGQVAVPERFRVLEIGNDYMLGVRADSLEVEHVEMYKFAPPSGLRGR